MIPCHFVASYPGPAQLSVALYPGLSCFSVLPVMESWVGPGYEASRLVFHDIGYVRMHAQTLDTTPFVLFFKQAWEWG